MIRMLGTLLRGAAGLLAALVPAVLATASFHQPTTNDPLDPQPNGPRRTVPGHVVLHGAAVHVSPGKVIERGAIEVRDGRIVAVTDIGGGGWTPPAGATAHDLTGYRVYAGFIDAYVETEAPRPDPGAAGTHWSPMVTPERSVLDGDGLDGKSAEGLRKLGFAAAGLAPMNAGGRPQREAGEEPSPWNASPARSGGIFRGVGAVVSLAEAEADRSLGRPPAYAERAYQSIAFELARESSREGDTNWRGYPNSQMGAIALIRQTFHDAAYRSAERAGGRFTGPADALDALSPSARPGLTVFQTEDELEALRAAKIAREFGLKAAFVGCGTEFRRLEAIKGDGLAVILPLTYPKAPDVSSQAKAEATDLREMMTWEQAPTNARRLDAAGLSVSLTTAKLRDRGEFWTNLRSAIRHGLAGERALAMLTTNPAALLGVSDQLGTIEPGRRANLVVASGDLFATAGKAAKIIDVWADGKRHIVTPTQEAAFAGTWDVTTEPAAKEPIRLTFSEDPTPKVSVWSIDEKGKPKTLTARRVQAQGKVVTFAFDHDDFGADGVMLVTGVFSAGRMASDADVLSGTAVMPDGAALKFRATRRKPSEFEGVWRVFEAEGKPIPDTERVLMEFKDDGLTISAKMGDEPEKKTPAEGLVIEGASATYTHSLKIFGMEGQSKDAVRIEGGTLVGESTFDDGSKHPFKARKQEKPAAEEDEDDAAKDVPEEIGVPFGPYQRSGMPAAAGVVAVTNATIWTTNGNNEVIEGGTLLVRDGKIAAVGTGIPVPEGATVIDAGGKHVIPGMIDCHSHTGISKGVNESGQAVTAEVRIQDVTDPDAISWYRQLAGGVTAVNNLHGSANPIGGQNCVNKVRWGAPHPDDMHFAGRETYTQDNAVGTPDRASKIISGIKFALGENVKQSNWGERFTTRYPQTRMGVETIIRDRFTAAREYIGAWRAHRANPSGVPAPRRDLELEALAEILENERLVHCHSYRQDEILMLARVSEEFNFRIGTYQHILEGYKVAEAIAARAIGASAFSDWWGFKVEVQDAIPHAGPIMWEQGVNVSYNSDSDELARRMNLEAAKAVKYSDPSRPIEPAEALRFVTINPAKQLGIDGFTGSLEAGKDADFVIMTGEPLSVYSRVEATYIDGRRYWSREDDAADRGKIAKERSRLVQKLLADKKRAGRSDEGGKDAGKGGTPEPKHHLPSVSAAQRAYYQRLLRSGMDPMAARPGECGVCDLVGQW